MMKKDDSFVKSLDFLQSRVIVDERKVKDHGEEALRFFDSRIDYCSKEGIGNGLRAKEFIPKGTLIWSADLEQRYSDVLTLDEVLSFPDSSHRQMWSDYTWHISGLFFGPRHDLPVEEAIKLEGSHFLNHSCEANVGFAHSDTSLVTIRDIQAGEMISNDYALTEHLIGFFPGFECNCGSSKCRKVVGPDDWRRKDVQELYQGHFTSHVARLIKSVTTDYSTIFQQNNPLFSNVRIGIEVRPHNVPEIRKGLFTSKKISKGDVIFLEDRSRSFGELISLKEIEETEDVTLKNFYIRFCSQIGRDQFQIPTRDPTKHSEELHAFFLMNHSCDPSTVAFGNQYIAARDIEVDEEITFDYATREAYFDKVSLCKCGQETCRGKVTAKDWQLKELQKKYLPLSWSVHIMNEMFDRYK